MTFTLDEAREDEDEALVGLHRSVYPGSSFDLALLRWRYREVPGGPARILVAREHGEIIAQLVLMPRDVTVSGERAPGWLIVDVMTTPAARGRGILRQLARASAEACDREHRIGCGYPNERSMRGFCESGFDPLCRIPTWEGSARDSGDPKGRFEPVAAPFGPWVESLWQAQGATGVHRDAATLAWRLARPDATYHAFSTPDRDALLVLKVYEGQGARVLNICELLVPEGGARLATKALGFAHRFARDRGASTLSAWRRYGSPDDAALRAAGLAPTHSERIAIVRPGPRRFERAGDSESWHHAQLDSDVF